jgi:excisionase family DNA binding protein
MPVRGTLVLPSADTETPYTPEPTSAPLTPEYFGIVPRKRPFSPSELAQCLAVSSESIINLIREGKLRAIELHRGTYRIPYREVRDFFMRQCGIYN